MNITAFNSGRQYTSSGQRIAFAVICTSETDGFRSHVIAFADVDREIYGTATLVKDDDSEVKPAEFMTRYDKGRYLAGMSQDLKETLKKEALRAA
jgi:hypothetical protein